MSENLKVKTRKRKSERIRDLKCLQSESVFNIEDIAMFTLIGYL